MATGYRLIEIQGLNHILEREGDGDGGRLDLEASDETDLLSSLLAAVPRHESAGKAMPSTKMHCHGSSMYYHHPLNQDTPRHIQMLRMHCLLILKIHCDDL